MKLFGERVEIEKSTQFSFAEMAQEILLGIACVNLQKEQLQFSTGIHELLN